MSPKRSTRTLLAGALSLSLLAALLAVPVASLAAQPSWSGNLVTLPAVVEPEAVAGYQATIINNGPSAISKLFVTAAFSQPYDAAATWESDTDVPKFVSLTKDGVPLASACGENPTAAGAGPLSCDLGALAAGGSATLVVAYQTTGSRDAGVTVRWTSVGTATTGDNSRGDVLTQIFDQAKNNPNLADPTQISNDGDFAGGFSLDGALVDNTPISPSNLTFTSMDPLRGDVANLIATVADDDAATDPGCPPIFAPCATLPTSELHLGDGTASYGVIKVVIEFHKDALKGINFTKLNLVHVHEGVPPFAHEVPKRKSCDGSAECAMFENLPGGHGRVTAYLNQNGWVKYH